MAHAERNVKNYLNEQFPDRWIGKGSNIHWAPRSPDLTPLDFFVWGYIRSKIYRSRISNIDELKTRITEVANSIAPEMLLNVYEGVEDRFQSCIDKNGAHVELNR